MDLKWLPSPMESPFEELLVRCQPVANQLPAVMHSTLKSTLIIVLRENLRRKVIPQFACAPIKISVKPAHWMQTRYPSGVDV